MSVQKKLEEETFPLYVWIIADVSLSQHFSIIKHIINKIFLSEVNSFVTKFNDKRIFILKILVKNSWICGINIQFSYFGIEIKLSYKRLIWLSSFKLESMLDNQGNYLDKRYTCLFILS